MSEHTEATDVAGLVERLREALIGTLHEAEWMIEEVKINDGARQAVRDRLARARTALQAARPTPEATDVAELVERYRAALERIADECEGTAPQGVPVGIASKCHRIARTALTKEDRNVTGG